MSFIMAFRRLACASGRGGPQEPLLPRRENPLVGGLSPRNVLQSYTNLTEQSTLAAETLRTAGVFSRFGQKNRALCRAASSSLLRRRKNCGGKKNFCVRNLNFSGRNSSFQRQKFFLSPPKALFLQENRKI
ncbi:MAG: hypothetical protein ACI353_01320, partial [Alloprevotella sp.]